MLFFGREREKEQLFQLIDRVPERGGALIVRGEVGVGKSTLLAEVGAAGSSSSRVLTTIGAESEENLPLPGTVSFLDGGDSTLPAVLPLSARLERACSARVAGLPARTRTSLLIAALNDSGSIAETLDAASSANETEVGAAVLAPAVEAGLIELGPGTLTFRHPLMRSAILLVADPFERQAAHHALRETLSGQPDRRAWHRAAATAGTDESVAVELELAADRAQRRAGVAAAIAALERSARLSKAPARPAERLPLRSPNRRRRRQVSLSFTGAFVLPWPTPIGRVPRSTTWLRDTRPECLSRDRSRLQETVGSSLAGSGLVSSSADSRPAVGRRTVDIGEAIFAGKIG
jgi:hypothetical protein